MRTLTYVVGLSLLLAALGCSASTRPPEEKVPPATVKWEGALQGALEEWTELVGTTTPLPDHVARVSAALEGRVLSVLGDTASKPVVEGQRVEKGTVLVRLDPTIVEANLGKAKAAQDVLREEERQAQYAVDLATLEVNRLRKLKEDEDKSPAASRTPLVSPVDRQKAEFALKDAQSKLKGARGRLAAGTKEDEALRAQLKLLTLTAPISGRLGRIQVVQGQTLSVGATVAEIVDLDEQIEVLCFVPSSLVHRLRVGQPARSGPVVKEEAAQAEPEAEGQIEYIAEQAEPETGNFAVKVRFANRDTHFRSNRVLRIRVLTHPAKECLTLRESAVSEDEETPTVVVVEDIKVETNADGKEETVGTARRVEVVLGLRDRTLHQVEVIRLDDPEKDAKKKWQGNVKDMQFVVDNGQGLQTGDKVKLEAEGD
jgi:RND family efflux transporter MFP subunit